MPQPKMPTSKVYRIQNFYILFLDSFLFFSTDAIVSYRNDIGINSKYVSGCTHTRFKLPYISIFGYRDRFTEQKLSQLSAKDWSVIDDWETMSTDTADLFDTNPFLLPEVQGEHELAEAKNVELEDELFVSDTIDFLYHYGAMYSEPSDPPLYDTFKAAVSNPLEETLTEIGMLVHCNIKPEDILIEEGRAVEDLTDLVKYDLLQLITFNDDENETRQGKIKNILYETTEFLDQSISHIFSQYSRFDNCAGEHVLDAAGLAQWMTKCLNRNVGKFSTPVTSTKAKYSTYKTGCINEMGFKQLYFDALKDGVKYLKPSQIRLKDYKFKNTRVDDIWRDFEAHGIISPNADKHAKLKEMMEDNFGIAEEISGDVENLLDACSLGDWDSYQDVHSKTSTESSHEEVQLAYDNETPKFQRDGTFVFIDEESCIGCRQCATIAPSTYKMLENGKARTFSQSTLPESKDAIASCPVTCMHKVSFAELKEMEIARDIGDGRSDHRHMGGRQTPMHVAGITSDANHKSSWYHHLKHKCFMSKACPQKGCYDCPMYSNSGDSPFFQEKQRIAEQVRLADILVSGEADQFRKTADL